MSQNLLEELRKAMNILRRVGATEKLTGHVQVTVV
jgi:hypothetical protein